MTAHSMHCIPVGTYIFMMILKKSWNINFAGIICQSIKFIYLLFCYLILGGALKPSNKENSAEKVKHPRSLSKLVLDLTQKVCCYFLIVFISNHVFFLNQCKKTKLIFINCTLCTFISFIR